MIDFILARAIHVISIVMWVGGVAFVTTVVMPSIRQSTAPNERPRAFHNFERRFRPQASVWVLIAGATGFWMTYRADLWDRFADPHYWWMHAMVALWLVFVIALFVVEPMLHRRASPSADPQKNFTRLLWLHRVLLLLLLITVCGAVAGSHGWTW